MKRYMTRSLSAILFSLSLIQAAPLYADKQKLDRLGDKRCKLSRETIIHHVFLKHEIYHILDQKQRQKLEEKIHDKD